METKNSNERLMIVRLGIHQWYPRKFDLKATKTIADVHGVSIERAGRFNKILVDLAEIKPLQKRLRLLRDDHYAMTCPFGDNGQRALCAELYFDHVAMVRDAIVDIDRLADDYAAKYDDERAKAKLALNGLFNPDDYPDSNELRARFSVDFGYEPLPSGDGVNAWTALDDSAREAIREELQASMDAAVEGAHKDVVNRIVEKAQHFVKRVREIDEEVKLTDKNSGKGRIHDSVVGHLRDIVDLVLRGLNVTGDQALAKLAADLDEALAGVTTDRIRNGSTLRLERADAVENAVAKFAGVYG